MKIAFVIDEYRDPQAGTEGQLRLLAQQLQRRGHAPRLAVLRGTDHTRRGEFPAPVDELGIRRMIDPRGWWRLYRWGRARFREGCRVVQIFFNDASVIGPWPLRLAGLAVIVSRRDMGFWYTPGILAGLRLAGPAVSALVANSHAAGQAARAREWHSRVKLHVIHNGLDQAAPRPAAAAAPAPPGGRIGIVANARPIKRLGDLIAAFAKLAASHPRTDLVIVGGGDASPLRAQAEALAVADRVMFTGAVSNPTAWLETFSVAVLCSASEGLSNAILEYMRAGLPVVATAAGGNPELVEDGVTGRLVPVADPDALAAALAGLLDDPEAASRLGRAGRERFETRFTLERMVDAYLALYRALADGARQAAVQARPRAGEP